MVFFTLARPQCIAIQDHVAVNKSINVFQIWKPEINSHPDDKE